MKTSVNIKMEESLRDQSKELLAQMSLDMTTAVNMFLSTVVREKRYEKFFAQKLREAEEQEQAGTMRGFDEFMHEVDKRYDLG